MSQVLIGLHRVGVVGLPQALKRALDSDLGDRQAVLDLLLTELTPDNYIPERILDAFRIALWREYLRARGEDFSDFLSEVEVTVRSESGEERDRFVDLLGEVFAHFELKPVITFAPPCPEGPNPQLLIGDLVLVAGLQPRDRFLIAVRRSLTDW